MKASMFEILLYGRQSMPGSEEVILEIETSNLWGLFTTTN